MNTYIQKKCSNGRRPLHPGGGLWNFGAVIGGEVFISFMSSKPLAGVDILSLVAANSSQLAGGCTFYHHDGDFVGGDDGFPLPDL